MAISDWELLRNHESFELVKRDYHQRHGITPNTQHSREIAAPFSHARSYFASAKGADQTVRPLLLYYGVVSLSRGLTLTLSRGRREATLAPAHGLSNKDWLGELSKPNPNFANLRVATNGSGTIMELANATKNRSLLRSNSSGVNYKTELDPMSSGSEYLLGDILARLPSLQDNHRRWRGFSLCGSLAGIVAEGNSVVFQMRKAEKITREYCDALFVGSGCAFDSETKEFFVYKGPNDTKLTPALTDDISYVHFGIGDLWLAARYPSAPSLSKLATLFALAYILGMFVRYYPTQWTALIRGQVDDAALPTIAAAIDLIELEYPQVVVDFLQESAPVVPQPPA